MIGFYNYTVILTYMSLLSALFGTHLAIQGNIIGSLVCLFLCGAFDAFDGMVARTKKDRTEEEKKFGIQIDSLVDMVSFGIYPIVIAYSMGLNQPIWFVVFALYSLGAVSRLGYFNVVEEMRQNQTTEKRKYYQGLPVTSSALIFPALYLLGSSFFQSTLPFVFGIVMAIVALAFVIDFKVTKPGMKGIMTLGILGLLVVIGLLFL